MADQDGGRRVGLDQGFWQRALSLVTSYLIKRAIGVTGELSPHANSKISGGTEGGHIIERLDHDQHLLGRDHNDRGSAGKQDGNEDDKSFNHGFISTSLLPPIRFREFFP